MRDRVDITAGRSTVQGAHNAQRAAVDDVCVDHRRAHVLVAEQRLDGADVRARFEQVRGEAVAQRVAGGALVEPRRTGRVSDGLLQRGVVQVVAHRAARVRIGARARGREEVLPGEARRGVGHLRAEGFGQVDLAPSSGKFGVVELAYGFDLRGEAGATRGRQERGAVVGALAATHGDLVALEVDDLDAQGQRLVDPQTRAVEQLTQEPEGRVKLVEQGAHGRAGEHGGEVFGAAGALEAVEGGHVDLEHLAVEKDQRAERLVLRRGRGALAYGQVVEKGRDSGRPQVARVASVVNAHEGAHPGEVRFLRSGGVVQAAQGGRDGFEEDLRGAPGGARRRGAWGVIAGRGRKLRGPGWRGQGQGRVVRGLGSADGWLTAAPVGLGSGRRENEMLGGASSPTIVGFP